MFSDDYLNIDAGLIFRAEDFDHAAPWRATGNGRSRDFDVDYIAVACVKSVRRRDADFVEKLFINRRNEASVSPIDESPDDCSVSAAEHCFDAAFAPARSNAGDASDNRVAVKRSAHIALADVKVAFLSLFLVFCNDEGVT